MTHSEAGEGESLLGFFDQFRHHDPHGPIADCRQKAMPTIGQRHTNAFVPPSVPPIMRVIIIDLYVFAIPKRTVEMAKPNVPTSTTGLRPSRSDKYVHGITAINLSL